MFFLESFGFWGTSSPRPPTGAPPLDPAGGLPSPRPPGFIFPPTGFGHKSHPGKWFCWNWSGGRSDATPRPKFWATTGGSSSSSGGGGLNPKPLANRTLLLRPKLRVKFESSIVNGAEIRKGRKITNMVTWSWPRPIRGHNTYKFCCAPSSQALCKIWVLYLYGLHE